MNIIGKSALGIATAAVIATGAVLIAAGGAAASAGSVNCPTVDSSTGAVTPAPAPNVDWQGCDLAGADLAGADMTGDVLKMANLADANLSGTNLAQANAAGADLPGAEFADTDLAGTVLAKADLASISSGGGVVGRPASLPAGWTLRSGWLIGMNVYLADQNLDGVKLSGADLESAFIKNTSFAGADLAGADLFGDAAFLSTDTWTGATCPDGSSARSHQQSCANAVAFWLDGFGTPRPGSTVRRASGRLTVRFRLATKSGRTLSAWIAGSITGSVTATLTGRGIIATTSNCAWRARRKEFSCTISDPPGIRKGREHRYYVTAAESPEGSIVTARGVGKVANPEIIHFR
jgi:uncharacterized protein YjbI with pentapeptide repeats